MAGFRDEWLQARTRARERGPSPSIERCWLEERSDGSFELFVRGEDLAGRGGVPTLVRVGGRPARRIDTSDPTLLRGVVDDGEPGDEVVVNLGPAGRITGTVEPAP